MTEARPVSVAPLLFEPDAGLLMCRREDDEDGVVLVHGEGLVELVVGDGDDAGFGGGSVGELVQGFDLGAA